MYLGLEMTRNPGTRLDPIWIRETRLDDAWLSDRAAGCARAAADSTSGDAEARSLRTAVRCLDHTSLPRDDPLRGVGTLCEEARAPLAGISAAPEDRDVMVASVCVFPEAVAAAVAALDGSSLPVAAACGFPDGSASADRLALEIRRASEAGAREIDAVVDRDLIVGEQWEALYERVRLMREESGGLRLKVILRSGTLPSGSHVARASLACAMAGADFIKTSTGLDGINATTEAGVAIAAAIRAYRDRAGVRVGIKPAGGLHRAAQAIEWLELVRRELGSEWVDPSLFRLGASSLLAALRERIIELEAS